MLFVFLSRCQAVRGGLSGTMLQHWSLGALNLPVEQSIQALAALVCSTKRGAIHNINALSIISV